MRPAPLRIALIGGYMPFFEPIMPKGFRAERDSFARSIAAMLEPAGEVAYLGLVDSFEAGEAAGWALAASPPDAVVVAPTMATPSGYVWAALAKHPGLPMLILNLHRLDPVPPSYDMPELCRHSSNVGTLMVANLMHRNGRRPAVLTAHLSEEGLPARIQAAARAAATAGALKRLRLGQLGRPLDGYANVDLDPQATEAAVGISIVEIAQAEWADAVDGVPEAERHAVLDTLRAAGATIEAPADDPDLVAASRMAAALAGIAERHRLDAGALNCRGEYGVAEPRIASLGCLALTHLAGLGKPFTCTGDLATAVAMWLGKRLGGGALYCELDAIDRGLDAFLCANTGEGDFAFGGLCRVFPAGAHSGRSAPGCCVGHEVAPGPATMIGFSPDGRREEGFSLVAMEGEVIAGPPVALRTPSAWFRPTDTPATAAFDRWVEAGATHHGSLGPGHLGTALAAVARHAGLAATTI